MKCRDSTGEVEPPGPHEIRAEHFGYLPTGLFKSRQPVLQCFCIVRPQVLDIQDGQIPRFKDLHGLAQRGRVGTLKDPLSGPGAEGARMIAPNKMEESAAGFGERAVDDAAQIPVVFPPDMFQHSQGDKGITLAGDVAVIVFDEFHLVAESQFFCPPAGEQDLLAGNIECADGRSVVFGHLKSQSAPAAACFHNTLPGLQLHLAADVVQFSELGLLQRCIGRREISTGIDELRVEPELEEICIEIVVLVDITAGAVQGVALNKLDKLRGKFDIPADMFALRHGTIKDFERGDEISVERDSPLAVGIAELGFRIEQQTKESFSVWYDEAGDWQGVCW